MEKDRRGFLRLAGATALGLGCGVPLVTALARASSTDEGEGSMRYAMAIDVDKCLKREGCTACADACHRVHNVPHIDSPEEEIKWIWKETYGDVFHDQIHHYTDKELLERPVVVLCNHCENPSCVQVCPTNATFKREDGIVMMDMHRCIGCRYCIVGCPYGARSFNWRDPRRYFKAGELNPEYPSRTKGVVEKCNFCAERLARGLEPACVEACNRVGGGALTFGLIARGEHPEGETESEVSQLIRKENTIRRRPNVGNEPHVFYIV
jgi:molybdopterin-containing oxidoreductase family iron-sulfur binding subunit